MQVDRGLHESFDYYDDCYTRTRNTGERWLIPASLLDFSKQLHTFYITELYYEALAISEPDRSLCALYSIGFTY